VEVQRMAVNPKLKRHVRAELFKCAVAGKFETYEQFYDRIHPGEKMGNFPYHTHFNEIAKEERANGYPDVTFLIHLKGDPPQYPAQIDFRPADPSNQQQLEVLRKGTDDLIALYCPLNTPNPYR
jgi:hypothetical protein